MRLTEHGTAARCVALRSGRDIETATETETETETADTRLNEHHDCETCAHQNQTRQTRQTRQPRSESRTTNGEHAPPVRFGAPGSAQTFMRDCSASPGHAQRCIHRELLSADWPLATDHSSEALGVGGRRFLISSFPRSRLTPSVVACARWVGRVGGGTRDLGWLGRATSVALSVQRLRRRIEVDPRPHIVERTRCIQLPHTPSYTSHTDVDPV